MRIIFSKKLYLIYLWYRDNIILGRIEGKKRALSNTFFFSRKNKNNSFSVNNGFDDTGETHIFTFSFTAKRNLLSVIAKHSGILYTIKVSPSHSRSDELNYEICIKQNIKDDFEELEKLISDINKFFAKESNE